MLLKMLFKIAQRDEKQVIHIHKILSVTTKVETKFHFNFFEEFLTVSYETK